ncbi:hypothetical protein FPY71_15070 [Aureimonas fodinaquatilis]|uniref:Nuclear transport factor 2 family protein n=1 Tax=Aureimonas fodinaquatilis TaxID=2565783 RepID=A0A5B0DQW0_9HYPH|nr:hypothetical protein [Aureimonas fodinaquatilis]KAA0968886.1 hypothetical protein FPY71_15070 [Aureimonas fodinaquatilis]
MPGRRGWLALLLSSAMACGATVNVAAQPVPAIGSEEDAQLVAILIRSTLVALHHANVTGNYSVLSQLAAPGFTARNTAADLAVTFAELRRREIDLQAVTVLQPDITFGPVLDENGLLRVSGRFATTPVPVRFELVFQVVDRVWRLIGIVVQPVAAE